MAGLPASAAEDIAIALSEVLGIDLNTDWVQLRKNPVAGAYEVVVVTKEVMARVRPYVDDNSWASLREPALVGWGLDGKPHYLKLTQHGQVVGRSGSGKTGLLNLLMAHTTRCADAVQWVCGVEKLYDLVGPWVEPYEGTGRRLPIDWIACGPQDTLEMLIAAMRIARWRQRQRLNQRHGWPSIRITLDEASFALRNKSVRGWYEGQMVTMSQMAAMIRQGARSAGVFLDLASQRSTQDHWGDMGGDVAANAGWTAAFASHDWAEIGRNMGNFRLAQPRYTGEYWLHPGDGDPIHLKVPYIQEPDPSKPRLHDGVTISDVAWARRDRVTDLDEGSAEAAGPAYARRHQYATPELFAYLTGEPEQEGTSDGPGAEPVRSPVAEQAARVVAEQIAAARAVAAAPVEVPSLVGRKSRTERIAEIVRAADGPMSRRAIVEALRAQGDNADDQVVTNALTALVDKGALQRPEWGVYVAR